MLNLYTLLRVTVILSVVFMVSCEETTSSPQTCDNLNVLENTYTGDIDVTSRGQDPGADFEGEGDSGTYSFEWCNPQELASLDFDITTSRGGSVRIILEDDEGNVVLDKTRPKGDDSFSGVSDPGVKGRWIVTVILKDVNGDGSYSMHPGD